MKKLFKLKQWLTLPEVAKHLSGAFEEDVTEADILQLALDGHLTMSVYFVNGTYAKEYNIERLFKKNDEYYEKISKLLNKISILPDSENNINNQKVSDLNKILDSLPRDIGAPVINLRGVFDLMMIGGEMLDIEHRFHQETGGPEVTLTSIDGTFVKNHISGTAYQLQESFDDIYIKKMKENHKSFKRDDGFFPAGGLPKDGILVVRCEALIDFKRTISEIGKTKSKSEIEKENPKTIESLLKMVIAMAIVGYRFDPLARKSETPGDIVKDAEGLGLSITDDTVRKWLREGAALLDRKEMD